MNVAIVTLEILGGAIIGTVLINLIAYWIANMFDI
jgi:hypothetical protein